MMPKLFIAISYDNNQEVRKLQNAVMHEVQPIIASFHGMLCAAHHLHVTLYFLGQYPLASVPQLCTDLQRVISMYTQQCGTHSLVHFTSPVSVQVLGQHGVIVYILQPSVELLLLYQICIDVLGKHNTVSPSRPVLPHVTLARVKKMHKKDLALCTQEVTETLNAIANTFTKPLLLSTDELILFQSDQFGYTPLETFII